MVQIVRDVRDFEMADREALEHVIGERLRDDQRVIISIVARETASALPQPVAHEQAQQVPESWNIYEGMSDEEVDRLDAAIRQRARLTRDVE